MLLLYSASVWSVQRAVGESCAQRRIENQAELHACGKKVGDEKESLCRRQADEAGAAMTAYARVQFEEPEEVERQEIRSALLRYCELDTLAMAMIYEAWREWLGWLINIQKYSFMSFAH